MNNPEKLSPFADDGTLNVIIDTPKGSRNKYKFDSKTGLFKLGGVLALGLSFPYDFGFIPGTKGEDGDPLDVLTLMDEPAFCGCLIPARLIGILKACQAEGDSKQRNDRLIAVADNSRNHKDVEKLDELNDNFIHEIEHFFTTYNTVKGKAFQVLGRGSVDESKHIIAQSLI